MSSPPDPLRPPSPAAPGAFLLSVLFVAWCFVVGTLLMYAPWMPAWARWTAAFNDPRLQTLVGHPTFRGAISGFGLFHLVWGTHDLDLLIARFLVRRDSQRQASHSPSAPPEADRHHGEPHRSMQHRAPQGSVPRGDEP